MPENITNSESIRKSIFGKRIMVTGGGGSIGSELTRQICECEAAKVVLFDMYENNAYELQQELIHRGCKTEIEIVMNYQHPYGT